MSSKLIPANPAEVMSIRQLSPNLVTLSVPFLRFGQLRIGGRATIVKLQSGALAVFSPVALTPAVQDTIRSLGSNVAYLIAPDIEHHIFLSPWHAAFPKAQIIAPDGLPEKRAKDPEITKDEHGIVPFSSVYTKSNKQDIKVSDEFDREFDVEYVDAHPNKELVFFWKPERTLIEADLMFNLPATEQYSKTGEPANKGLLTKLFGALQSTDGTAIWQKRLLWYGLSNGNNDRAGFNDSVRRIEKWDFDRIVPCHGDVIETGGKGIFKKVFEWHLQGQQ